MRSRTFIAAAGLLAGAAAPALAATTPSSGTASAVSQVPSQAPTIGVITFHGCYNSAGSMETNGTIEWCSRGSCGQDMCRNNGWLVGGTMGGDHCYCGNEYPNTANLVGDGNCSTTCAGTNEEICGGNKFWTIYNTGLSVVVDEAKADESVMSSSSSSSKSSATAETTHHVTEAASTDAPKEKSSTNTAGIAAGSVVGVVAVAGAMGGMFFYMRRKRNMEIEQAHRSATAASGMVQTHKSGASVASSDGRLDPMTRRFSSGSIDESQDYSRRILKVTNA